ncbi:UDP-glycosyltransferase 88F5-like [Cajanus cajan]|uniref:UDP-glycosyltransferase 88F5-like n=1 Tax=Cajanus cajan TaxID=3821 RepID=UPI00098D94D0|nr:UDP-glycosyltransferase 88F5-like [Cajanus cajan]
MQGETIVLYPAPGIGHIISMVELAKLIHKHHFSTTILLTTGFSDHPSIDAYIRRISAAYPTISFLRLPHVAAPTAAASFLGKCFTFVKSNVTNVATTLTQISESATIKAFVIDLFCTSAMEPASSLQIPVYYFFTSGAAVLALCCYLPTLHRQTTLSFKDMVGAELQVPGNAALKAVNMPEPMLDRNDIAYCDMLDFCTHLPEARGIIVNSFPQLEPAAVKAVAEGACFPNAERAPSVHYIGPLIAEPQQSDVATENKQCLSWLDEQPSKSVVFLCFGSRGSFSVSQMKEIANGLERSGLRFLWVVKRPTQDERIKHVVDITSEFDLASVLPSGFIERTKYRGLVVKLWAPQVEVLSHDSVGGFVSHCGWNSVLEGVIAGVPMIAWPLYAEQHVNRHVMVEQMKVAIAVEQNEEDGFVSGEEVEKRVRELMESQEIRETSLKLKHLALAAVGEFGSSTKALANLVQAWSGFSA